MKNIHKCRYCANANLYDCNFEIKDMNKDCIIYCDTKKIIKQNINRQNKCDRFVFNPICVVTGQEVKIEKTGTKTIGEQQTMFKEVK